MIIGKQFESPKLAMDTKKMVIYPLNVEWVTLMLTVSHKIKLTVIAEDFPVEVDGAVAEHNSLLHKSTGVG